MVLTVKRKNISSEAANVGDFVYDLLKEKIISLELQPGQRISEKEIAESLTVSRTPVREAFIKLSREGLLYVLPQRGTYISQIDLKQVEEARFIRETLEIKVLEMAVDSFPKAQLEKLKKNLDQQKACMDNRQFSKYLELDESFHKIIFEGCDKAQTWRFIDMVNTQYKRIRLLSFTVEDVIKNLIEQHTMIYEAIRDHDQEKAYKIITNHIRKLISEQQALKKKYPGYFM
ncbi:GntR family transcriptional regulator [Acidaminobacter hydrogenoformans]|uniref:DNA-binding transcriptional regulator, GntR family n=1 Tax=Acidaminobacter hydrogenoformans DSM 2784 TaxID=1120920 RepID=A0A1G5RRN6_9FIRM|nr:GntR family transcriptional regulator [Acidaminobacter hydrogenoformans]SCZ76518.1 DNA-binding transcriptional regulator, GntR family [Acidaminobacter hydrogenoformans DSM 2784]